MNAAGSVPTDAEYQAAIQNPGSCFVDPELRSGKVELSPLQLPKPRSGNFATVYKIIGAQSDWAVRCFTRSVHQDQRERYEAIGKHLEATQIRYVTGFKYIDQGIRVGPEWYPVVKMEWVHGESLATYVEKNLGSPQKLLRLAHSWAEMAAVLHGASIAHGDLQHGNVLVVHDQLKLVDYDGMFVPALAGRVSHETGHRNYQHPARTGDFFNQDVDNFSAWAVFVSILALAAQPSLWQAHKGGDDCLLFRKSDFVDPAHSALLRDIRRLGDPGARTVASMFEGFVLLPPEQIPPLDGTLMRQVSTPASQPSNVSRLPSWMSEDMPQPTAARTTTTVGDAGAAGWVLDMLEVENPTETPSRGFAAERVALAALSLLVAAVAVLSGGNPAAIIASVGCAAASGAGAVAWRYRRRPEVARYRSARDELRSVTDAIKDLDGETKKLLRARDDINSEQDKAKRSGTDARRAADDERTLGLAQAQGVFITEERDVQTARATIASRLSDEERRVNSGLGSRVAAINQELAGIQTAEVAEVQRALTALQERFVREWMTAAHIRSAGIRDVGQALKERLEDNGVHSAWDATYQTVLQVYGFGRARASAVAAWRSKVEAQARRQIPPALDFSAREGIAARYRARAQQLNAEVAQVGPQLARELAQVRARAKQDQDACNLRHAQAVKKLRDQEQAIEQAFKPRYDAITEALRKQLEACSPRLATVDTRLRGIRDERLRLEWKRQKSLRDVERMRSFAGFAAYAQKVLGNG
jgi:hypothetical protein